MRMALSGVAEWDLAWRISMGILSNVNFERRYEARLS